MGQRTLSAVGADDPAVALRLDRLHAVPGRPDRHLDAVIELLEANELGAHLDPAAQRAEVRAEDRLRAELRDLERIVLQFRGAPKLNVSTVLIYTGTRATGGRATLTRGRVGVGASSGLRLAVDATSLPPGILYHFAGGRLLPWARKSGSAPRDLKISSVRGCVRHVSSQAGGIVREWGGEGADLYADAALLAVRGLGFVDDAD